MPGGFFHGRSVDSMTDRRTSEDPQARLARDRQPYVTPSAPHARRKATHPFDQGPLAGQQADRPGKGWADPQTPKPSSCRNKKTAAGFRPAAVLYGSEPVANGRQAFAARRPMEKSRSAAIPLSSARRHQACRSAVSCSRDCEVFSHSWRSSSRMVTILSSVG